MKAYRDRKSWKLKLYSLKMLLCVDGEESWVFELKQLRFITIIKEFFDNDQLNDGY